MRNMIEYVAAVFVVVVFGLYIVVIPNPMIKLGSAMIIAATIYVVVQLNRRASAAKLDPSASAASALAFHRAQLDRQRKAVESIWLWYLGPLAPGMLVFILGPALVHPPHSWGAVFSALGCCAVVFGAVWWLNWRAGKMLRGEIEKLDALSNE